MCDNLRNRLYVCSFSNHFIEAIKTYNLGMEINHTCISECLDEDLETRSHLLKEIQKDIDLSMPKNLILHGPFTEIYPAGIDYRARAFGMERLNQAYEVATHFNINRMVVHTGWMPQLYFKSWQAEKGAIFWKKFMEDKPKDFNILIENVLEDEPYMLREMMEIISDPRIKLCLDVGHANATTVKDLKVENWIEVLAPYIDHFHLHNNDGTRDAHHPFTLGTLNFHSIMDCIGRFCNNKVTFTIESGECLPCLKWLHANKYI